MSKSHSTVGVLPLKVLCQQAMILAKSKENVFSFIKSSFAEKAFPDYGYKTKIARLNGQN